MVSFDLPQEWLAIYEAVHAAVDQSTTADGCIALLRFVALAASRLRAHAKIGVALH